MRRNLDLEHYTKDEEYEYLGLHPKPWWFKNLEKAWESNRKEGEEKRAAIAKKETDEMYKIIGFPPEEIDKYIKWSRLMAGYNKRPVGRPKLPSEQRKKPKVKRSEQMRQLLKDNGIIVLEDSTLEGYPNLKFLPNGRVGGKGLNISVHQFLQNLNGK